jgi:hypothetical protein
VTTSTLHVVFSSPAGGKPEASTARHCSGGSRDNLALGPINPPDLQMRLHWIEEELH